MRAHHRLDFLDLEWVTKEENREHAKKNKLYKGTIGICSPFAKLTEKEVLEIRAIGRNMFLQDIADIYGISKSNVSKILLRQKWNHI